ncbi:Serine/threonine-protein phosphatase 2A regulatory subunit B'' subunit alpha [Coemansia sp. RSA 1365]|nr:Serine/threonine-protein phosphatase 2A regulatory subunit B'' subunit alpha [Coemansia sp. RSA 1365]
MVLISNDRPTMVTPQRKGGSGSRTNPSMSSPILQADELTLNPRWSPHLKSPRPNSTISSRLRQQSGLIADSSDILALDPSLQSYAEADDDISGIDASLPDKDGSRIGGLASPLNKRARILQTGSPESLPPLSPVVSNRKRSLRNELVQDTPFPFSPSASGLRIRYSPSSSPLSPTLRATPNRGEPESPTLSRILAKDSPSLSLDEKLGGGIDDESPTVSQMSRSLLFRLDLESPLTRRAPGTAGEAKPEELSPLAGSDAGDLATNNQCLKQPTLVRRSSDVSYGSDTKLEQKRRKLVAVRSVGVPQIFVSPSHPRTGRVFERQVAQQLEQVRRYFDCSFGAREVDFAKVTTECGLPRYANRALFYYVTRNMCEASKSPVLGSAVIGKRSRQADREAWPSFEHFCEVWTQLRRASADIHALLFNTLVDDATKPRPYLTRADIKVLVSDVIAHHYELEFLDGQDQFLGSFTETVVERIFYDANRTWDGRLVLSQFRKSDVVGMLRSIEDGIDVGVEAPGVFSYKHFYVFFCSFFELDLNRDGLLDARDLLRYFNGTLSRRIISRIMMGKGRPSEHVPKRPNDARAKAKVEKRKAKGASRYDLNVRLSDCRMAYRDFIWFLLSEIDKTSPTAVEYWFRCLDLDGDGVLSIYELEYFYDEQISRMEEDMTGDIILLDDLMCQLSDLVRPQREGLITLGDLRRVPPSLIPVFFDAFMNLARFIEHDSRTSFLQRQLAHLSMRALPTISFDDVIQMRMDFLASIPNPWSEFADLEYQALLNDHEQYHQGDDDAQAAEASTELATAPAI